MSIYKTAFLITVLMLSGCASYTYKGEKCEVSIYSMRSVEDGLISIDKNCQLKAGSASINSTNALNEIIKRIPIPTK